MNDQRHDDRRDEADAIGELIRRAGRRENPSREEYDRVFAATSAALGAKVRNRRRRTVLTGIAATVLLTLGAVLIVANLPPRSLQLLAEVDRVVGPAEIRGDDSGWRALHATDTAVLGDMRIRTGPDSRLGVLMANGVSLRLAESTELRFTAPGQVELLTGKVYADAAPASGESSAGAPRIVVRTGNDETWDVGTQFEVRYAGEIYRLRVREGLVHITQTDRALEGAAGEQLTIDSNRNISRTRIAADDPEWRWTESVAPDPDVDQWPVSELLAWVSRQTGREVEFAAPGLELKAEATMLYGGVRSLEPLEALDTLLATTDFDYTLTEDGKILIDSR